MKGTCKLCGKSITLAHGGHWVHVGSSPRHPAVPSDTKPRSSLIGRAESLRDKVKQTWEPPLLFSKTPASQETNIQTSVMITMAWVFGKGFLGLLTENQDKAVDAGLEFIKAELDTANNPSTGEDSIA